MDSERNDVETSAALFFPFLPATIFPAKHLLCSVFQVYPVRFPWPHFVLLKARQQTASFKRPSKAAMFRSKNISFQRESRISPASVQSKPSVMPGAN